MKENYLIVKSCRKLRSHATLCQNLSTWSIWSLPEEILIILFRGLHIRDLLSLRSTCTYFRDLIDNNSCILSSAAFDDTWPSEPNIRHFERAAKHGNLESMVKLGVAYLYNEGFTGDFAGQRINTNGDMAAKMFCQVETLTPHTLPFTWVFIRPPWVSSGACCKECVFNNMKSHVEKVPDPSVCICIAQTLMLLEDEVSPSETTKYLQRAAQQGSAEAALLLWKQQYLPKVGDRAQELQSLRKLRDIAASGHNEAQYTLCQMYAAKRYGGISATQAASFVRDFIQGSKATKVDSIYRNLQLTASMRYILMDWLVEVASMKEFSSLTLHVAISVVDRYLCTRMTSRSRLQLVGVAAMVICSRLLGRDIITIREAAWLTDNTYRYEDVVRMMGEITAALRGKFRTPICLDYLNIITALAKDDSTTRLVAEYVCELSLLQSDFGDFAQGEVAAACVVLARIITRQDTLWSQNLVEWTGFTLQALTPRVLALYEKCFNETAMVDHRDVTLQAVKQRYSEEHLHHASEIPVPKRDEVCALLGVTSCCPLPTEVKASIKTEELIMSPSRGSRRNLHDRFCPMESEREKAATPSIENMSQSFDEKCYMNESIMSGYEGDQEDEGDSFWESEGEFGEDLASLWCTDMVPNSDQESEAARNGGYALGVPGFHLNTRTLRQVSSLQVHPLDTPQPHFGLAPLISAINLQSLSSASFNAGLSIPGNQPAFSFYQDPEPSNQVQAFSNRNLLPLSDLRNRAQSSTTTSRKRKSSAQVGNENTVIISHKAAKVKK